MSIKSKLISKTTVFYFNFFYYVVDLKEGCGIVDLEKGCGMKKIDNFWLFVSHQSTADATELIMHAWAKTRDGSMGAFFANLNYKFSLKMVFFPY